jgi:hypothetical protein
MITEVPEDEPQEPCGDGRLARRTERSDEHKGRTGRFFRCTNCGRSPLLIRHCNPQRICAVCEQCGHHQAIKKEDLEAGHQP